jgi:hypothetical protein
VLHRPEADAGLAHREEDLGQAVGGATDAVGVLDPQLGGAVALGGLVSSRFARSSPGPRLRLTPETPSSWSSPTTSRPPSRSIVARQSANCVSIEPRPSSVDLAP